MQCEPYEMEGRGRGNCSMRNAGDVICGAMGHKPYETGGTKVFWGTPLTNGAPSKVEAAAKSVEGDISEWEV